MNDTVSWSESEWYAERIGAGFVRLSRCRDGPSALANAGDSVCISTTLLADRVDGRP